METYILIGSALPPTSIVAYLSIIKYGVELILSTALDSHCNLEADCMSQKLIRSTLRLGVMDTFLTVFDPLVFIC